ncbi:MAG: PHP domain-containing protein [Desulfurococcaceae archaeon TW002]
MIIQGDLHIHSYVSDGEASPEEIVKYSIKKGLSVISITDHNTFLGSLSAIRKARSPKKLLVIPGAEIRTLWGDVLVLCQTPIRISANPLILRDEALKNHCLLIPAHPFDVFRLGIGVRSKYASLWDAYEVFNSSSDLLSNLISFFYLRNLSKPLLSNSDAHTVEGIGSSRNIFEVSEFSVEEVLEAIRKNFVRPVPSYSISSAISKLRWGVRIKPFSKNLKERYELYLRLGGLHPHL